MKTGINFPEGNLVAYSESPKNVPTLWPLIPHLGIDIKEISTDTCKDIAKRAFKKAEHFGFSESSSIFVN